MKCATTSLHDHLGNHPDIFMSDPKEPAFFVPEIERWPNDVEWYLGLSEGGEGMEVVGESSTHYTKIPDHRGVPERIAEFCDDPRFIYVVRDPIDRIVSHYWDKVEQGMERRPMLEAVREDTKYSYQAVNDYKMQLEPYFERFGRDRALVLPFERLVAEPRETLPEIYRWLGVKPDPIELDLSRKNRRAEEVEMPRGRGILDRFSRTAFWETVHSYVPSSIKSIGAQLARGKVAPSDVDTQEVVEYLRPQFQTKVRELEAFLSRTFPRWTTTFPSGPR